ncbi:PF10828 family protein [Providencia alcalifaciens F90-2004]|nr:PF10828 family protein [Providencia alcalifaciens F90-2004]
MTTLAKFVSWIVDHVQLIGIVLLLSAVAVYNVRINNLETENESLTSQLSASKLLNKVTQSAITLHYQVSLNNIKSKQLEDSEHVKVKTVIKTVLKDNECANTAVPDDVVSELRKYKRGIDSRSVTTDTSAINR